MLINTVEDQIKYVEAILMFIFSIVCILLQYVLWIHFNKKLNFICCVFFYIFHYQIFSQRKKLLCAKKFDKWKTSLEDDIYAVTNISVESSSHIQILLNNIPVKVSFFLEGIRKSGLIIEMTILKI